MKFKFFQSVFFGRFIYLLAAGMLTWAISYHFTLITSPIQQEYREGAQVILSRDFIQGVFPYSFASVPLDTNPYGVLYLIISYIPAKLFGSTFLVHRTLSGIFLIASLLILFAVLQKNKVGYSLSIATLSLVYLSFLYGSTPLSRPDALGELLFLAAVFIPYLKKFSYPSLFFSCALLFLILFTKLYFATGFFIVFLYLFIFISKKKAFVYGSLFSIFFISWISICFLFFDVYINQVIGSMAKATNLSNTVLRLQLNFYLVTYMLIFILAITVIIRSYTCQRNYNQSNSLLNALSSLNLTAFNRPLLSAEISYLSFGSLITFVLLSLIWGRSDGGWMGYFYQLLSPFLLLRIALLFNNNISQLGALIFLVNSGLFFGLYFTSQSALKDDKDWGKIRGLIESHQNIYGSAAVSGILTQSGKQIHDTGLSLGSWASIYKPFGLEEYFHDRNEAIQKANDRYCDEILRRIDARWFDLVLMYGASIAFKESDLESRGYRKDSVIPISFPHNFQNYHLSVWTPKSKPPAQIPTNKICQIYQ